MFSVFGKIATEALGV